MSAKGLKILIAATALGVVALAQSGPADARPKRMVVAADDDVAPRLHARRHRHRHHCGATAECGDDYFFATRSVEPGYNPPPDYQSPAFPPTGYRYGFYHPGYDAVPVVYEGSVLYTPTFGAWELSW